MILKALNWLRLIDERGLLSLTNVAVIVILVKLCLEPTIDLAGSATLLTVLGGYHFKSWHEARKPKPADLDKDQLAALQSEVSKIKLVVGMSRLENSRKS